MSIATLEAAPDSVGQDVLAASPIPSDTLQTQADDAGLPMPSFINAPTPDPNDTWLSHSIKTQLPAAGYSFAPGRGGEGLGAQIIAAAEKYLGQPYEWGALDCSGLVQRAYAAAGIDLPRVSYQQANTGTRVALNKLRPGDLVAWDNSSRNPGADHIAIYAGNGWIIESPAPGEYVRRRRLGRNEGAWGVRMGW